MNKPFGTSDEELKNFFPGMGEIEIRQDSLFIRDYPFEPSSVYKMGALASTTISSVSFNTSPQIILPTEVIMVHRKFRDALQHFASKNNIPVTESSWTWSWILEPFLDTELSDEMSANLFRLLGNYGFTKSDVINIRNEVEDQMMKYNFDTMLWEWGNLDLFDVLCAMRTKYDRKAFNAFYWTAMEIELRTEILNN